MERPLTPASSMKLKILTFNWHEPYLCLMAKLGHQFYVLEPEIGPGHIRRWDENMRPRPENVHLVSMEHAEEMLLQNDVDLAIAHNIKDLIWMMGYDLPKIAVFHNRLTTEIGLSKNTISADEYKDKIKVLLEGIQKVFISESKRRDWGLPGEVILPGLDVRDFGGYTGERPVVLRVGNLLLERDLMMGFTAGNQVVNGYPGVILGLNPAIRDARLSRGFGDLLDHYRHCRLYLNATTDDYEDGYNLAMLEAMAVGMPVVSLYNKTSPIRDGINGFISKDIAYLKRCVALLLEDPDLALARDLGRKARETVQAEFGIQAFLINWNRAIEKTIRDYLRSSGISLDSATQKFHEKKKKNILMDYVSYPATTAFYIERALRKSHNVVTCGATITPEIVKLWNLEALKWEALPQDIFRPRQGSVLETMNKLPDRWHPDLYLWVENGIDTVPPDLDRLSIPKACYLIDTHIHLEQHKEIARYFDFVFLAQRRYVDDLKAAGSPSVHWLPLACDPEIHGMVETGKKRDVTFVGSVTPAHVRRKRLLETIGGHFDLRVDRKFMDEMALAFSQSKIVFNEAIDNDLNMRVFEALCSGSLLVTDEAPGSGLTDLFADGKHLVLYRDETLVETIGHYLRHPEERERIARQGREEVLEKHTYERRAEFMISTLEDHFRKHENDTTGRRLGVQGIDSDGERAPVEAGPVGSGASPDGKPDSYYRNVRHDIFPLIPQEARCILEVGCASGLTGRALKETRGAFVAGIEMDPGAAREARRNLDDVLEGNIETLDLPYQENSFDCIILADILEHLVDPLAALKKLRGCLKPAGTVVASIPNVQFFGLINNLAEGNWTYQKEGILDETHLRFFTFREIEKLFQDAGFAIEQVDETLDPQFKNVEYSGQSVLKFGRVTIKDLSREEMRRFFVFQYKIAARPLTAFSRHAKQRAGAKLGSPALLEEARKLEDKGDHQGAMDLYNEALGLFPGCAEALAGIGNCHLRLQNPQMAKTFYRKAVSVDENSMAGWFGLGLVRVQFAECEAAIDAFSKVLAREPGHDRALCGVGLALWQRNAKSEAMDYFVRSLNVNVENKTALKFMLELAYELERFHEGEEILKRYLELHPAHLSMVFGLAGIQFKMGRYEQARENLERILVFQPDREDALQLLERVMGALASK
ncbi:MAG: glycosyltransferase [Nitrospinae bacterium]|nr:glycosyltransferase [Nitrospinota bacterium]